MTKSELVTRPLTPAERRWLRFVAARRERCLLRSAPYVMLLVGIVLFGGFWGLSVLARNADKTGPSWRVSGFFFGSYLGLLLRCGHIVMWKPHRSCPARKNFEAHCGRTPACEIRVISSMVIECNNKQDRKKGWCAFQFDDKTHCSSWRAQFCRRVLEDSPPSDFSIVDIADEKETSLLDFRGTTATRWSSYPQRLRAGRQYG